MTHVKTQYEYKLHIRLYAKLIGAYATSTTLYPHVLDLHLRLHDRDIVWILGVVVCTYFVRLIEWNISKFTVSINELRP